MQVSSVGAVAFPVLEWQIRRLIAVAERAPYGRGPETIVDSSVRDCWQVSADDISLGGARWPATLEAVSKRVADGLGIPADRIDLDLYKLLIYEEGGFFKEHRDTEKTRGMVGTLVISLPTEGAGGELVVRHHDREEIVDLSVTDPGELVFAAFYADCAHRTEPVRGGHRVSLIYNVVALPEKGKLPRLAPDVSSETRKVAQVLTEWASGEPEPKKIVWVLDHLYTEAALDFEGLKGRDAVVCRALANAARISGCEYYLALLQIDEEGTPEDYYGYGEWDEDPVEDEPYDPVEVLEIYQSTHRLTAFVGPSGRPPNLAGGLPMNEGEALPSGALDDAAPDSQRVLEATGNSGATLERAYRATTFVVWPRSWHASVLADGPVDNLIEHTTGVFASDRESGLDLVKVVVDQWLKVERQGWSFSHSRTTAETLPATLSLLIRADDEVQTVRFLEGVMLSRFTSEITSSLVDLMERVRGDKLEPFLKKLVTKRLGSDPGSVFRLFAEASSRSAPTDAVAWTKVLRRQAARAFQMFPASWARGREESYKPWPNEPDKQVPAAVRDAILVGQRLDLPDEGQQAAKVVLQQQSHRQPATDLPRRLQEVWALDPELMSASALALLWRNAAGRLLERSSCPPGNRLPRTCPAPACQCQHCRRLTAFCQDPRAAVLRFRMRKDLRMHVEFEIQSARLPIECATEKKGIPHTLVCTKDSADYIGRVNRHRTDVALMKVLLAIAPTTNTPWVTALADRLRLAIGRATK